MSWYFIKWKCSECFINDHFMKWCFTIKLLFFCHKKKINYFSLLFYGHKMQLLPWCCHLLRCYRAVQRESPPTRWVCGPAVGWRDSQSVAGAPPGQRLGCLVTGAGGRAGCCIAEWQRIQCNTGCSKRNAVPLQHDTAQTPWRMHLHLNPQITSASNLAHSPTACSLPSARCPP